MSTTRERRSATWRAARFQAKIGRFVAEAIAAANRKWPPIAIPDDFEIRMLGRDSKTAGLWR